MIWLSLLLSLWSALPCEANASLFRRHETGRLREEIPCAAGIHMASLNTWDNSDLVQTVPVSLLLAEHLLATLKPPPSRTAYNLPILLVDNAGEGTPEMRIELRNRIDDLIGRLKRAKENPKDQKFNGTTLNTGRPDAVGRFLSNFRDAATLKQTLYERQHSARINRTGIGSGLAGGILAAIAFANPVALASGLVIGMGAAGIHNWVNEAHSDRVFFKFFDRAQSMLKDGNVGDYVIYAARQSLTMGAEVTESGVFRYPNDWTGVGSWQRREFDMLLSFSIVPASKEDPTPHPLVNLWIWER